MRTTITLADETHEFVTYYANARGLTFSAAINELIRRTQAPSPPAKIEFERSSNGLPLLPRIGRAITCEMVKKIEEEEFDPKKFA